MKSILFVLLAFTLGPLACLTSLAQVEGPIGHWQGFAESDLNRPTRVLAQALNRDFANTLSTVKADGTTLFDHNHGFQHAMMVRLNPDQTISTLCTSQIHVAVGWLANDPKTIRIPDVSMIRVDR